MTQRFERRRFEQGQFRQGRFEEQQFSEAQFSEGEFSGGQFEQNQFTVSEFTRNQFELARFQQLRFQRQAFERRTFEQRTFTLGDRIPETGQWEAVPPTGAPQPATKLGNAVIDKGSRIELYRAQPSDAFPAPDVEAEIAEFLSLGNCRGYLNGQTFNCPEETQETYGVLYAVQTADGIVLGGDRPEPVLIEGATANALSVARVRGRTVLLWAPGDFSVQQWVDGVRSSFTGERDSLFLGGGYREGNELTGSGDNLTAIFRLTDSDGNATAGTVSGTNVTEGSTSVASFSGTRPILPGITRPCSVQQTDGATITGTYDAHQTLLLRGDGNRALVMHRFGSVGSGRSQSTRVYTLDREGNETTVNSSPGLLLGLAPVTPTVGTVELTINSSFGNYLDGTQRPIFDALIGLPVVLSRLGEGGVIKGYGTITAFTTEAIPTTVRGDTRLLTATVAIERVISVPFDGALSAGDCALYSNSGSVIDFLLQSNCYVYSVGSGNLAGLGESGDLNAPVPLTNFNIVGNNGAAGTAYATWQGNRVFVSDSRQTARNLEQSTAAFADEWRLVTRDGMINFVKRDRPLRARRTAVFSEESELIFNLSSSFYPR